jgi:hypothetical protein
MARLCERPGCSEPGATAYGMAPEDLVFWITPLEDAPVDDHNVLCQRHADAMVVPRGWTLDDRREPVPRLFAPRRFDPEPGPARPARRSRRSPAPPTGEQLQIDGTGEIPRSDSPSDGSGEATAPDASEVAAPAAAWQPEFDHDDDLGGLLEVDSPLLARAFRGTGRRRT